MDAPWWLVTAATAPIAIALWEMGRTVVRGWRRGHELHRWQECQRSFRALDEILIRLRAEALTGPCDSCGSVTLQSGHRLGVLGCGHCGREVVIADRVAPRGYHEKAWYAVWLDYRVGGVAPPWPEAMAD